MPDLATGAQFDELFRSFRRSAVRLETRQTYRTEVEAKPLRQFLAGEPVDLDWFRPWVDDVRSAVQAGRQFRRVRLFQDPLTDYLRFELWMCQFNIEAGEQMTYLPVAEADRLNLPNYDYWLFDNERLALMYFTNDGVPQGAQIVTDSAIVDCHQRWLNQAAEHAIPYREFADTHPVHATTT